MSTLEKQQYHRHVNSLSVVMRTGGHVAEEMVETILALWSQTQYPALGHGSVTGKKNLASDAKVQGFVNWLCQGDLLHSAYWLSSAYAFWIEEEKRRHLAMFFTPPSITQRLLDDLERSGVLFAEHTFYDPACGGAAFLAPIAQRIRQTLKAKGATAGQILAAVGNRLFGTDLDPVLCRLSKQFLRMVLASEIAATKTEPELHIATANSLLDIDQLVGRIDVVVCNPPYRKMPASEVRQYANRFSEVIEAQPNLYGLFIAQCVRLLRSHGVAALVTPTSFLSGQSFSKLRHYLMTHSEITQIGIVADKSGVFIGVEQETALTLLRRRLVHHSATTTATVKVVSRDGTMKSVGPCVLPSSGNSWPIPRDEGDAEILRIASASHARLADYGYRPRIGALVWNRDKRQTYASEAKAKLVKKGLVLPLLWSSDIRQNETLVFSGKSKVNGEPSFVKVSGFDTPAVVSKPAVLLQRVTSNEQPKRLVAAPVPTEILARFGGFVGENHTVILEALEGCIFPPERLAALLGSTFVDRYFRCISGATNVSIFELSQLPLPSPHMLLRAIERGLDIDAAVAWAFRQSESG
jgi:adenine-specific DNA-methyltransferase